MQGGCIMNSSNYYYYRVSACSGSAMRDGRPYHRHCNCALHNRTSSTDLKALHSSAATAQTARDKLPSLFRRSWRQGDLSLSATNSVRFVPSSPYKYSSSFSPPIRERPVVSGSRD